MSVVHYNLIISSPRSDISTAEEQQFDVYTDPYRDYENEDEERDQQTEDRSQSVQQCNTPENSKGICWTTKDTVQLIDIIVSERISLKFQNTKKSHIHIWNDIATELSRTTRQTYSGMNCRTKFNHLKAQYMKRRKAVDRSGSDPTALHDWQYYTHIEPYFRNNRQVTPANEEHSLDTESLKFPRKRKITDVSDLEANRDKRFQALLGEMVETKEALKEHMKSTQEYLDLKKELIKKHLEMLNVA